MVWKFKLIIPFFRPPLLLDRFTITSKWFHFWKAAVLGWFVVVVQSFVQQPM